MLADVRERRIKRKPVILSLQEENRGMTMFRSFMCLTLIALVSGVGVADEKEKTAKGKRGRKEPTATQRFVGKLDLTEEQKVKVAEIDKQFATRTKDLARKKKELLTDEQMKAQRAAAKTAREAGKKGAEARKAVMAAVTLTDEQKTKQKELQGLQKKLSAEVVAELKKVLTEEQEAKLPGQKRGKGKAKDGEKKGRGKKKADAAE